jgi:hypothetical protein
MDSAGIARAADDLIPYRTGIAADRVWWRVPRRQSAALGRRLFDQNSAVTEHGVNCMPCRSCAAALPA